MFSLAPSLSSAVQALRIGTSPCQSAAIGTVATVLVVVAVLHHRHVEHRAEDRQVKEDLALIRDAIEFYIASHRGALPPCTGTGEDLKQALQPFLREPFPRCSIGPAQNQNVATVTGSRTVGERFPRSGWKFNLTDGSFICNYRAPLRSDRTIRYDQL